MYAAAVVVLKPLASSAVTGKLWTPTAEVSIVVPLAAGPLQLVGPAPKAVHE